MCPNYSFREKEKSFRENFASFSHFLAREKCEYFLFFRKISLQSVSQKKCEIREIENAKMQKFSHFFAKRFVRWKPIVFNFGRGHLKFLLSDPPVWCKTMSNIRKF